MSIFRAYDIRGIFGKDLTLEIAENIGKAFGVYIGNKGEVVVGRDCRLSSPELREAIVNGLTSSGCDVLDIGMVPTPVFYFTVRHYKKCAGVMITGSHNPPEYNGFKLCKGEHTLYGEEIQELKKIIKRKKFKKGNVNGYVKEQDVTQSYINFLKKKIKIKRKLKAVVDPGNGTSGPIVRRLFKELGCDIIELNFEPDGRFLAHFPDPTVDKNLEQLIKAVRDENADLGIAYDGDADRLGLVDDLGNIVRGDQALILFSREILKKNKRAKIIFEVKCSQALIEEIEKNGGIGIMYRTGHSFIKKKMKEENALLAGEMSGHFFFRDNYYGYDDGIFASARMLELLSKTEKKFSDLVREIPKYFSTPEIRIHCPDNEKFRVVEELTKNFQQKGYDVITVDGARIQFKDGWGLVRASNTEPALILRFEAKTEENLGRIENLIKEELRKFLSLQL